MIAFQSYTCIKFNHNINAMKPILSIVIPERGKSFFFPTNMFMQNIQL
jgi:hypothetical protein